VFANKEKRPVSLKLEGTLHLDRHSEFTRGETSSKMHSVQDGKVEYKVDVTEEPFKAETK
jgi:hypothetical protein